jgi:protein TonB
MKKLSVLLFLCLTHCFSSSDTKKVSKNTTAEQNVATATDDENTVSEIDTHTDDSEIQIKEDTTVYNIDSIDVKPDFRGGIKKLDKYIDQNIIHPEDSINSKGTVYASFIIETNGTLTNIKVLKDIGYGIGPEVIRALKRSVWNPGQLNGKTIRVSYSVPITIK